MKKENRPFKDCYHRIIVAAVSSAILLSSCAQGGRVAMGNKYAAVASKSVQIRTLPGRDNVVQLRNQPRIKGEVNQLARAPCGLAPSTNSLAASTHIGA